MQFSDTTNYTGLIQDIDFLLFGDGTTFNEAYSLYDRTRNINLAYDKITALLFRADPNFLWDDTTNSDYPIATTALVSNQANYSLPDSSLVIHQVRVKDTNGDFTTLDPIQRREASDSDLNETGTPTSYYKIGKQIFLVPTPDYGVSNGIEFYFQRGANHFTSTDTTETAGFASIFHEYLSISAALRYAVANGMATKITVLRDMLQNITNNIEEYYRRRSPDRKPSLQLKKRDITQYGL